MSEQGARDANAKLAHQSLLNAVERANRLLERLVDLTELGVVGRTLSVSEGLAPCVESGPIREAAERVAKIHSDMCFKAPELRAPLEHQFDVAIDELRKLLKATE